LNFLRLIRIQNLIIIALAQFLIRYCLIFPAYKVSFNVTGNFPDHLSLIYFCLLVASTLLIAAGGNIINDTTDTVTDEYNKPGANTIGRSISTEKANKIAILFFGTGIILGFITAMKIGKPIMGMVQVFSAVSLYLYSSYYQKKVLSGNILIAFLSALSLLIVGLFEPDFYPNFLYLLWYVSFAFGISLVRELVKDIEDLDGDEKAQYITFAVRYGKKKAQYLASALTILNLVLIDYILYS
jgi:4-hydroxybenzoate polyprenyltransferase